MTSNTIRSLIDQSQPRGSASVHLAELRSSIFGGRRIAMGIGAALKEGGQ
jgi:hypothetical protein